MVKKSLVLAVSAIVAGQALAGHNEELAGTQNLVIEITAGLPQAAGTEQREMLAVQASPTTDGGDLLQSLNGITGIRMGGRAIDPVIRGQSQNQLNILLDGAYIHGGCPNRMDPPTSYASVDSYDLVTVIKGSRTVVYGGGGSGGTVLFEREWPALTKGVVGGDVSSSYHSNGDRYELGADVAGGSDQGYVRAIAHKASADNYHDGNGDEVRSSFESRSATLLGGYRLTANTTLEGSVEKTEENDVLFAGAGMDSPYADAENSSLTLTHVFDQGALQQWVFELYRSDVKHNMDNFSLRTPPAMPSMRSQAPSTSYTTGGRLVFDARAADIDWIFGADFQNSERDAELQSPSGMIKRLLWAGADIDQAGVFVEGATGLGQDNLLVAGLRYDHVTAEATRRDERHGGLTPDQIWQQAGSPAGAGEARNEDNLGGFISWTRRLDDQYSVESTLSRSVRSADATERYMGKRTASANSTWIGNPTLAPETHHQLEIGLQKRGAALSWAASGWYNRVDDYILRYRAGIGDTYRNVAAELYGADIEMQYRINPNWTMAHALAWTVGNNRDDNTPLSRIAPLQMTSALDYQQEQWRAGIELMLVATQNDVCLSGAADCGGQDVRKTPGYGVINLHGQYEFENGLTLVAGIDNLTDKAYTLHESRDDAVNPVPFQVQEPGRSGWLRLTKTF